jgi:hypothetical protein
VWVPSPTSRKAGKRTPGPLSEAVSRPNRPPPPASSVGSRGKGNGGRGRNCPLGFDFGCAEIRRQGSRNASREEMVAGDGIVPLVSILAAPKSGVRAAGMPAERKWWPGTELNRRHKDFQSSALPTELPGHSLHSATCYCEPPDTRILVPAAPSALNIRGSPAAKLASTETRRAMVASYHLTCRSDFAEAKSRASFSVLCSTN